MSSDITVPETSATTKATPILVPASFRYFGDITQARSSDSGILAMATHLNKATNTIAVGISLTPPGVRYDKTFSRSVALYRLQTHLADTVAELSAAEAELRVNLASVRGRVQKTSTVTKFTESEYKAARALHPNANASNPANVGYRSTSNTYFEVDDFTGSMEDFTFTVMIPEDATHLLIDKEILEFMLTDRMYPKWLQRTVIIPELQAIQTYLDSMDDELTVDDINESFDDLKLVENSVHGFFVVPSPELAAADSITPVTRTREELAAWFMKMAEWVLLEPAIYSESESTSISDYEIDEDPENDDTDDDDDDSDDEDEDGEPTWTEHETDEDGDEIDADDVE